MRIFLTIRFSEIIISYLIAVGVDARYENINIKTDWWETALFYQIYPRSFVDSDGDGIGDLNGIISRLDYLRDLGVDAAWLSPIFKSPMYDYGYDVSDYYGIQPEYGSLEDFEQLIKKANALNIKIILDFVPNHTSNESEWFIKSSNKDEYYSDWYVWENGHIDTHGRRQPPNNWISVFKKSAWTYMPSRDQFYLHQFSEAEPDLNYRNPVVGEEIKNIVKYWLEKGVAGMRFGSINYLFETDKDTFGGRFPDEPKSGKPGRGPDDYEYLIHVYTKDQEETFDIVSQFRDVFDALTLRNNFTRVMITVATSGIKTAVRYYGDSYHIGAHIPVNSVLIDDISKESDARDLKHAIDRWISYMPLGKPANWVTGNHDTSRVASRFRPELVDAFNMLVLLLPGIAFTYMGEEIGMVNGFVPWVDTKDPRACSTNDPVNFIDVSRDPVRTPLQWNNGANAGFSTASKPWLPVADGFENLNIANQRSAVRSHYQVYRTLTNLRRRPAFRLGRFESLAINQDVFAFKRWYNDDTYVIVMNLGKSYQIVNLTAFDLVFGQLEVEASSVQSSRTFSDNVLATYLDLSADEALVLRMQVGNVINQIEGRELDWWETTIFYRIYPRSFADSDGDGIGDLNGIISKLDYIKDIGVGAIWLSPIFQSPMYDFGYDISDFYSIHEDYGTMEDLTALLARAIELDIKVILDLVPNHTSNESMWFQQALNRSEKYYNYFIWESGITDENGKNHPPNNWRSHFRGSAWKYKKEVDKYYLHQFRVGQPDLNYNNPDVVEEMKNIFKFWLDKGIAGIKVDAANCLFEVSKELHGGKYPDEPLSGRVNVDPDYHDYLEHIYTKDQKKSYNMVYDWRDLLDEFSIQDGLTRVMMIEVYATIQNVVKYFGASDREGAQMPINLGLILDVDESSSASDMKRAIDKFLTYKPIHKPANWVVGNHDNSRMSTRYGPTTVDGINMIVLLLPGVAVTYMGEEIGMLDGYVSWEDTVDPSGCNTNDPINYVKSSRDPERTPFHWNGMKNAGFSTADKTWLPIAQGYETLNVEAQKAAERSHLSVYRTLADLRQNNVFRQGRYDSLALNQDVFVFKRWYLDNIYLIVVNMRNKKYIVDLTCFENVYAYVAVVVRSVQSPKYVGDTLIASALSVAGFESLVLKHLH